MLGAQNPLTAKRRVMGTGHSGEDVFTAVLPYFQINAWIHSNGRYLHINWMLCGLNTAASKCSPFQKQSNERCLNQVTVTHGTNSTSGNSQGLTFKCQLVVEYCIDRSWSFERNAI